MYSILESALGQMIVENNNENIDFSNYPKTSDGAKNVFDDFIKPYVKINYDAGTNNTNKQTIMYCDKPMKLLNGSYHSTNYCKGSINTNYYGIQLKDGSVLIMRGADTNVTDGTNKIYFNYDINGKKGPNTVGKDIFVFYIDRNDSRNITIDKAELIKKSDTGGWLSTQYIIKNNNMDYLKCKGTYDFVTNECN